MGDLSAADSLKERKKVEKKDKLLSLDDVKEGRLGSSSSAFAAESNMMDTERLMYGFRFRFHFFACLPSSRG